jgi:hypothetical protein
MSTRFFTGLSFSLLTIFRSKVFVISALLQFFILHFSFLISFGQVSEEIQQSFKNPPADCWPHTRWWWPGNPVSEEEITWQLEQMSSHGIKGVEQISMGAYYEKGNPIYVG